MCKPMSDKDTFFSKKLSLNCHGRLIDISTPKVFGILNVTPDSFYDGGRYQTEKDILEKTAKMVEEGADFIDVGAYSSRPGAENISEKEELKRLDYALNLVRSNFSDIFISVDTFRAEVAKQVVRNFKVDIINDISAGVKEEKMFETIADMTVPYVMMHMQGSPETMHLNPSYENVTKEVIFFFSQRLQLAKSFGIKDIIIDPGFGFGKNITHNYQVLNELDVFKIFGLPVLVGLSRKSLIYKTLKITPEEALNGSTVLNTIALMKGADFLRVHDVKQAKEAIKLVEKMKGKSRV